MITKGKVKFLLKQHSQWGYHVWVRYATYDSAKSAKRAAKSLRRIGWFVDTAYPTKDHEVVAVINAALCAKKPRLNVIRMAAPETTE